MIQPIENLYIEVLDALAVDEVADILVTGNSRSRVMTKRYFKDDDAERRLPSIADLTPAQQQYIGLLNQGRKDTESATMLGVSTRTLLRWRENPIFIHYWNESLKPLRARIEGAKPRAFSTLLTLLGDNDSRVRLAACLALLKKDLETKSDDRDEIEETIAEIEKYTNKDERVELAKQIRAYLDAGDEGRSADEEASEVED